MSGRAGPIQRACRLPLPGDVLVQVGEAVAAGQAVARAVLAGRPVTVPLSRALGLAPAELARHLLVREGEDVQAGQVLARVSGVLGLGGREVRAPLGGRIERLSPASGQATLRGRGQAVEAEAPFPGIVRGLLPGEGAWIGCTAVVVGGVFGVGPAVRGPLTSAPAPGAVWVCPGATAADLARAREVGAAALVAGSIGYLDVLSFGDAGPALLLTEGFGRLPMATGAADALEAMLGRVAWVDPTTAVRAGAIRPEIIVPLPGADGPARAAATGDLDPGRRVKVVRSPGLGLTGTIRQTPAQPRRVPSGAVVLVAVVATDGAGLLEVPLANLEALP